MQTCHIKYQTNDTKSLAHLASHVVETVPKGRNLATWRGCGNKNCHFILLPLSLITSHVKGNKLKEYKINTKQTKIPFVP